MPLLHGLEPTFIKQLARVVTSHMLLPEEIVFRKGDLSKEMCARRHKRMRSLPHSAAACPPGPGGW